MMHPAAADFCAQHADQTEGHALDLGGYDVNGNVRGCWPNKKWTVIDQQPFNTSLNTEFVYTYIEADAALWTPDREYDLVICTEVFEHTPKWPGICNTAFRALKAGGMFLATCAGPGRAPHSGIDGGELRPGEYYHFLLPHELGIGLRLHGFKCRITYNPDDKDIYAFALKL